MLLFRVARVLWSSIRGNRLKNAETQLAPVISLKSVEKRDRLRDYPCDSWSKCPLSLDLSPISCHTISMNKTQAIDILSTHYGASYQGSRVIAITGNLIEDIMNEGDEGKTFHKWNTLPLPTTVEDGSLIGLAEIYLKKAA